MPVLMEPGAAGRAFSLLPGVRCLTVKPALPDDIIEIGIVNNMPDAALESTERQFVGLLAAAAEKATVRVRLFALPDLPRGPSARDYVAGHYAAIDDLWDLRLHGLIVTGTEPRCDDLRDEPYWGAFTRLVDWAERTTTSTLWSCLAAHAAVLHLDGIERRPFAEKCFGIFECEKAAAHALTAALATRIQVPHSRWNDVPERDLVLRGYHVLSRGAAVGADMFVKPLGSLFVFLQGHPEYEATTLGREYRRDIGRYMRGERAAFPSLPHRYFDETSTQALEGFRVRATVQQGEALMENYPATAVDQRLMNASHAAAVQFYRNWLAYLAARQVAPRRAKPRVVRELAQP